METKTCTKCNLTKLLTDFHFKNKAKGTRNTWCKECAIKYRVKRWRANPEREKRNRKNLYQKQRRRIYEHYQQNPCVDCGESDPLKLTFDHVRGIKKYTISNMAGAYGWAKIKKEIEKCDVRCANCHQKKTALEQGFYSFIPDINTE